MIIQAKFSGTCTKCGNSICIGDKINWEKGVKGSSHEKCPAAKATGPKVASAPTPDKTTAPIQVFERRGFSKPDVDDRVGDTLRLSPKRRPDEYPNAVVTVVAQRRNYMSRDDAEDFGSYDDAGWTVTLYCRLATEEEKTAFETREAAKATEKAAKDAAVKAAKEAEEAATKALLAKVEELKEGLLCTGECGVIPQGGAEEVIGKIPGFYQVTWRVRTLPDGTKLVCSAAYGSDDYRFNWWGPAELVQQAWLAWGVASNITPESAKEWLAKYKGCSGTEAYAFLAAQAA